MRDLSSGYAFGFSISLTLNAFILGVEKLEIIYKSHSASAHEHCRLHIFQEVLPRFMCFSAASIVSGLAFSQAHGDHDSKNGIYNYFTVAFLLASSHILGTIVPLLGYLLKILHPSPIPWHYQHIAHRYGELIMLMLGEGRTYLPNDSLPWNILQPYFFALFPTGVLSIILVPVVANGRYYATFGFCLVTVQLLQLVHFGEQETYQSN